MWIIYVNGRDSGQSISGKDECDALIGAVQFITECRWPNVETIHVELWD